MKKIKLTKEQEDYIKQELIKKRSCNSLRKEMNIGEEAFLRIAHEIMGPDFSFKHKSYINLKYFSKIDTKEKAYWLGFISADGWINGTTLSIQLQWQDKEHLQKFSNAINGNLNILEVNKINNFGTKYHHCRISVRSQNYVDDLKKYGVVNNKSLILKPPLLSEEMYPYWIIGLIDGDGSITKNKKKIRISLTSTKEVLNFIKDKLSSNAVIVLAHTYQISFENAISENFLKKI